MWRWTDGFTDGHVCQCRQLGGCACVASSVTQTRYFSLCSKGLSSVLWLLWAHPRPDGISELLGLISNLLESVPNRLCGFIPPRTDFPQMLAKIHPFSSSSSLPLKVSYLSSTAQVLVGILSVANLSCRQKYPLEELLCTSVSCGKATTAPVCDGRANLLIFFFANLQKWVPAISRSFSMGATFPGGLVGWLVGWLVKSLLSYAGGDPIKMAPQPRNITWEQGPRLNHIVGFMLTSH